MRRGHPGVGRWRKENPRHFRPRTGVTQFRPFRNYSLLETPRFPPINCRPPRGPQIYNAGSSIDNPRSDHYDNHNYRNNQDYLSQRQQEHGRNMHYNERQSYPMPRSRYHMGPGSSNVQHSSDLSEQCHINSLGDIDDRHVSMNSRQDTYSQPNPLWEKNPAERRHNYDSTSNSKPFRRHSMHEPKKLPVADYAGHRPPVSDNCDGSSGPTMGNSGSFSRSVDDTVDIVRKRLLNLSDPHYQNIEQQTEQRHNENTNDTQNLPEGSASHEHPVKRKLQRQTQTIKSNCDQIKKKIAHQLFKMDKDKMCKLMDNPSSSSKFEYAISSLITESQNSFNRHMRSVAEKSLCSSTPEMIDYEANNTIYEDTFMKQMQCILDPQDTVLLEDIKPIVMAELQKVLRLDDVNFEIADEHTRNSFSEDYLEGSFNDSYKEENYSAQNNFTASESSDIYNDSLSYFDYNSQSDHQDVKPLFERRPARTINDINEEKRASIESRRMSRKSEDIERHASEMPLFDSNTEQLSEEEDTFAELDNQYHVAVDHNFIEADDLDFNPTNSNLMQTSCIINEIYDTITPNELCSDGVEHLNSQVSVTSLVKQEATNDINTMNINNTQAELSNEHKQEHSNTNEKSENSNNNVKLSIPNERKRSIDQRPSHRKEKRKKSESNQLNYNKEISNKISDDNAIKSDRRELAKTILCSIFSKDKSGKESKKDSARPETVEKGYSDKYVKRKLSPNKPIENKDRKRHSSLCSSHSIQSPNEDTNSNKKALVKAELSTKVKLKTIDMFTEQPKKNSSHQAHRNTAILLDSTVKLKKGSKQIVNPRKSVKTFDVATQCLRKMPSKETQTAITKSSSSRFCQTIIKRCIAKSTQTEPVIIEKSAPKATDTLERMKEIDMEIQELLQEKFKLYNSLESKDPCPSTVSSLGMTVLNVKEHEISEDTLSGDAIADDFTNIPVKDLEQIAMETIEIPKEEKKNRRQKTFDQERKGSHSPTMSIDGLEQITMETIEIPKVEKKNRRQRTFDQERKGSHSPTMSIDGLEHITMETIEIPKVEKKNRRQRTFDQERKGSHSPAMSISRRNRKVNTPNISLIEQIITDDRPLEDIISLEDLETAPVKTKKEKKTQKSVPKKKYTKKNKKSAIVSDLSNFNLNCYVRLIREDLSKYLINNSEGPPPEPLEIIEEENVIPHEEEAIVEETVVNDIQFDMLDVSEDIVIGESCEVKLCDDKDDDDRMRMSFNEEIILDNSQSSSDDVVATDTTQTDNQCKLYDYSTDENLLKDAVTVTGNADAVLAIECIENNFVAACLDGNVYYFSGDGRLLSTLKGSNLAVTCLTIVKEKSGTTIYTGSLDSRIRYYDLETGLENGPEVNVLSPIQTMDRAWDTIFVGTRTGFVLQFECKNNMLIPVSSVKFSEQSILALKAMKEGPRKVLLVAARSDNVTVKDAQTGLLLRTLSGPKMTVYSLLYEDGKVYCGTSTQQIYVFDYTSGSHVGTHLGGKGAVCLRACGGLVFAGCYDGCVYAYREGEGTPFAQLRGPSLMLLSLAVVGDKIIAGYKDRSLYIWTIPPGLLKEMIT